MKLKGKVAVLSGAGRKNGVGAATAKILASQGCHILINCLKNQEQAETVMQECRSFGVEAELMVGDVSDVTICQKMAALAESKWGRTDIVVNCVGVTKSAAYEKLEQLTAEDFSKIFAVNVTAPYLMAQAFQKLLRVSHGVIINVSSAAGITGKGSSIAYAAAKGAENTLTLALSQALSPEVRVNAVCPNFIDSSWWEESFRSKPEKYQELINTMKSNNLMNKVLKPSDVAETIVALIHNPLMTGELIRLDAGAHVGVANPR